MPDIRLSNGVNLSVLSDAELGALVRRTLGESLVAGSVEKSKAYIEERQHRDVEARERQRAEMRKRRSMQTLPEFTLLGITYGPLSVAEEAWGEVAPDPIAKKYLNLAFAMHGVDASEEEREGEVETMTWQMVWAIHYAWTKAAPTLLHKLHTIMAAMNIEEKDAFHRMPKGGREALESMRSTASRFL